MEYIVEEYLDNELVRTVTIQDVLLSPGKTYTGSIPEVLYVDNEVYALVGDKDEVIEVDTDTYQPTGPDIPDLRSPP